MRPKAASSRPVTQEPITFQEIKATMPRAYAALSRIDATTAALAKSNFHNTKYGFSIDTLEGRILKRGNYHSITYPIYRDMPSDTLENLVLNLRKDGNYTAVIVQYDLSLTEQKVLAGGDGLDLLDRKVIITEIDVSSMGSNYTLDSDVICYQSPLLFVQPCSMDQHGSWNPGLWHECTVQKPVIFISFRTICEEVESGGTGGTGTGSGPGGSGTGSGQVSMGSPHPAQPIGPGTPQQPQDDFEDMLTTLVVRGDLGSNGLGDPCNALKLLSNNPVIKSTLAVLISPSVNGSATETAFNIRQFPQGFQALPQNGSTGNEARLTSSIFNVGAMHIHQDGASDPSELFKMFSLKDIRTIYTNAKNFNPNQPTPAIFFNIMVTGTYTYIAFPNNVNGFKNFDNIFENKEKFTQYDQKLKGIYLKLGTYDAVNQDSLARRLLSFLNNMGEFASGINFDISLYRKSNSLNNANWEKIELDPANAYNLKTPVPCN